MSASDPAVAGASAKSAAGGELRMPSRRYGLGRVRFFRFVEEVSAKLGGRAFYRRRYLAPGRFRVRRETLCVANLPAGLEGLRIAHLSDLHGGSFLGKGDLRDVVASVNATRPHVCVLTGDLITRDWREALPLLEDLAGLKPKYGSYAVFGNHDYKRRQEHLIAEAYAERGIRFLRNEAARIDTGRGVLAVVGLEDLEEGKLVDVERARRELLAGDVEIVLCHNPGGGPGLARAGCAAVLSGHTHGNQIDLPLLRRLGPEHPGERFEVGATSVVTNLGLGVVGVPLRIGAPTEFVLLELVSRRAGTGSPV